MKKLLGKDKAKRINVRSKELLQFISKSISNNLNYHSLIRWNAISKLNHNSTKLSIASLSNRCQFSVNKKRLNKYTFLSRHIYLKLIRSGKITGTQKTSW
jgi:ribosomal protein S14